MVAEPKTVRLRDREVSYLLKRSRQRRSILLTVDEKGLTVSAPWRSSERRIVAVIREAEAWVIRKIDVWSAYPARHQSWVAGETIRFLGREIRLRLVEESLAARTVLEAEDCLQVCLPDPADPQSVKASIVQWYRRHAQTNFTARVADFAPRLGVPVPRLLLSGARTRWGSCTADGHVRLNWRLIQAGQATIDYVVVHELAHLIEMNHSGRFWNLVAAACPHHKEARAELDHMGRYYMNL